MRTYWSNAQQLEPKESPYPEGFCSPEFSEGCLFEGNSEDF